ncbi:MAG: amino acid ABC transporter permease [Clostridia bacterium]|nr:amino acid ABC transporter permease [Clostridia bacterium]
METFLQISGELLNGFSVSVMLFIFTLVFSLPLGLIICFLTTSKFTPVRAFSKIVVWILRGTPLMLQIFAIFYLPGLLKWFTWPQMNTGWKWFDSTFSTRFIAALVAFSINYAAYFSEIYRGGIQSIPYGQYEAGKVLGLNQSQVFFKVVFMQVIKRILPPMSNEIVTLIKDTALATSIGIVELIFSAKEFMVVDGLIWPLFYAGAFYLIFVGIITVLFNFIEKKLSYYKV